MPPRPRVLIAEDDPALREILTEELDAEGFDVLAVADGQEAVELHGRKGPFDVLLFDEDMPKLRGLEALAVLRGGGVVTPALFMSGGARISDEDRQRLGVLQLLRKPVTSCQLAAALRDACRRG